MFIHKLHIHMHYIRSDGRGVEGPEGGGHVVQEQLVAAEQVHDWVARAGGEDLDRTGHGEVMGREGHGEVVGRVGLEGLAGEGFACFFSLLVN
ncbi:hypothetical protein VIGAN_01422300 [Vigna angularis var. angularis]|uniref:Uncharacterized protein n=1 Tax=Vigna angularis var. angularis TaxID=157739 RepID=A0A0S3R6R3_PHAAN|nr:hypothetical protein VIGAN_01422300 [Vigna angularis var. angularis]